jgi:hypothetical protein
MTAFVRDGLPGLSKRRYHAEVPTLWYYWPGIQALRYGANMEIISARAQPLAEPRKLAVRDQPGCTICFWNGGGCGNQQT